MRLPVGHMVRIQHKAIKRRRWSTTRWSNPVWMSHTDLDPSIILDDFWKQKWKPEIHLSALRGKINQKYYWSNFGSITVGISENKIQIIILSQTSLQISLLYEKYPLDVISWIKPDDVTKLDFLNIFCWIVFPWTTPVNFFSWKGVANQSVTFRPNTTTIFYESDLIPW